MRTTDNKALGRRGEKAAAAYLRRAGYLLIAANMRCGAREVDIIVRRDGWIIFVEVKTRLATRDSRWEDPLGPKQISNLRRTLIEYCLSRHIPLSRARLDLVIILVDPGDRRASLRHYRDI